MALRNEDGLEQTQLAVIPVDITNGNGIVNGNNVVGRTDPEIQKPSTGKMTMKKFKILATIFYGNLFLGSCYSLMAPIYPAEAERKKCSASAYGLVFGVYQLVMCLASPLYGKIVPILKPGFMMKAGMLVSGICVILFSFMHRAPNGTPFIALSILVRAVDALGAAAYFTASYAIVGSELPDFIGRAMALVETAFSFGLAVGPVIGGILFQVGGFSLPFLVVGILLLTGTVVNFFLFRDIGKENVVRDESVKSMDIIKNVDFLLDIFVVCTCFAMLGFNEATLEPHIRQFNLSPTIVGLIFLIEGVFDAISAPLFGFFVEKWSNIQFVTIFAAIGFLVAYIIIGPLPFFNGPTYLSVVIVSQILIGFAMGGEIVCCYTHGMKHTVERGFPDDVGTTGLVSGILFSVSCFGAFFGPTMGGIMVDTIGYKYATFAVVVLQSAVTIILASRVFYLYKKKKTKKPEIKNVEKTAL